jgi:polysaccharide deacetylase 2 family uncharacterized protein YibQ
LILNWRLMTTICCLVFSAYGYAGKIAIVIDDFGYRKNTEEQILQMPREIAVSILPNSPLRKEMEAKAKQQGREILIHIPMAPFSKQPLEKDTLFPTMSEEEITRIIRQAIANVPNAKGMNNHMGSAMTADLAAMKIVLKVLEESDLYFLDSMTTSRSQVSKAAEGTSVKTLKRHIFLDDDINEAAIYKQFNSAIKVARKQGYAVVIGHPHPATVKVLKQMIPQLPADIELVTVSSLLGAPKQQTLPPPEKPPKGTTEILPMPEIIDIPREQQEFVSEENFKEAILPCPIEVPADLNVPSQFSILLKAIEENVSKLSADDDPDAKEKAYLYIS